MNSWEEFFNKQKELPYFNELLYSIDEEYSNFVCYPPKDKIFAAYKLTPFNEVKVIILGQDPYHNKFEAMGLAFSVNEGIKIPPSLVNIFKEIESEYHIEMAKNGDLTYLAKQGVLLLNTYLTVRENAPLSHKNLGYGPLITNTIKALNEDDLPKVFILWGSQGKEYEKFITNPKHCILKSAHPSPLSAYRGFFGNNHFIKTNEFLKNNNRTIISWKNEDEIKLF